LPPLLRGKAEVEDSGRVRVRVVVPRLLPQLPVLKLGASTDLGDADG